MSELRSRRGAVLGLVAASVAAAIALAGCSGTPNGTATTAPGAGDDGAGTVDTLNLLVVPTLDATLVYYAKQQGIFQKHGLDVSIKVGQGGPAIAAALQSGGADLGIVNMVSVFSGTANNLPLSAVAPVSVGNGGDPAVYVMPKSGIKSVADLKGKKIGVNATGAFADLTTDIALNSAGLKPSDVTYVTVPVANLNSALTTGQVDAVVDDQPSSQAAQAAGAVRLFSCFSGDAANLPIAAWVASKTWISGHAGAITKFRAALQEAIPALQAHQSDALALVPTFTSVKADQLSSLKLPTYLASFDKAQLQKLSDLMLQYGILKKALDATTVLVP